jgi:uncharacterized protein YuzE
MRMHFDEKDLRLDEAIIVETEQVSPGIMLDFDERKRVVGIELLGVKEHFPAANPKKLLFEVA